MMKELKVWSRHIYLPKALGIKLEEYARKTYGSSRRVISVIIQHALEEYLDRRKE